MKLFKSWWLIVAVVAVLVTAVIGVAPPDVQAQYQVFLPVIIKSPYEPAKGGIVIEPAYLNTPNASSCEDLTLLGEGWYFNNTPWPSTGPGCFPGDRRFVPRLYNDVQVNDPAILDQAIENAKVSGWLLGFVEPNLSWQGNVTPANGALAWKKIEDAITAKGLVLGVDIKLVAPAPNQWAPGYCYGCTGNQTNVYGYQWVWYMVDRYKDQNCPTSRTCKPHFDAMAWNYYYNFQSSVSTEFVNYFTARRNEGLTRGLTGDIWIMEYAGACWNTGTKYPTYANEVMDKVTPWLVSQSWVKRHAWFGNRLNNYTAETLGDCSLIDANGNIKSLGIKYRGY
ncbi:MAG: hypothetical protein FOGNACKC_00101 [Anaerolineae bacterium]|nr:hypothetical protein [Anaerolineae bacterium]